MNRWLISRRKLGGFGQPKKLEISVKFSLTCTRRLRQVVGADKATTRFGSNTAGTTKMVQDGILSGIQLKGPAAQSLDAGRIVWVSGLKFGEIMGATRVKTGA